MTGVQIFGVPKSQATRAAERFFKERRAQFQLVDLSRKPMAPGEIQRFIARFGLPGLIDAEGKPYIDAGLRYMKMPDAEWLERIAREPRLLRLPLVRSAHGLSIGRDENAWKAMLAAPAR